MPATTPTPPRTEPLMVWQVTDRIAEAIYNRHWKGKAPRWENASEDVRAWVHAQAEAAVEAVLASGWGPLIAEIKSGGEAKKAARPVTVQRSNQAVAERYHSNGVEI